MNRVSIILKKDLKEYWILALVILVIPVIVFYLPINQEAKKISLGIVGNKSFNELIEVQLYQSKEQGIKEVIAGKIDALYVSSEHTLYGNRGSSDKLHMITSILFPGDKIKVTGINSLNPRCLFLPLLFSILIVMLGLIGTPIVIQSEKEQGTLTALFLTPLSYKEFVVSKSIFGVMLTFLPALLFMAITRGFIGNVPGTLVILILASFLICFVAIMFFIIFPTMEHMFLALTPILLVVIFLEVLSGLNNYSLPLPVSMGLYKSMIDGVFPFVQSLMLSGMIFIIFAIDVCIVRVRAR